MNIHIAFLMFGHIGLLFVQCLNLVYMNSVVTSQALFSFCVQT